MATHEDEIAKRLAGRALSARATPTPARSGGSSTPGSRSCAAAAPASRPRVADIVAAAGLSNDAFYRHFAVQGRAGRGHPRGRHRAPAQLPRPPDGQGATGPSARCAGGSRASCPRRSTRRSRPPPSPCCGTPAASAEGLASGPPSASAPLATLLVEPFAALGSADAGARRLARGPRGRGQAVGLPVAPAPGRRPPTSTTSSAFCLRAVDPEDLRFPQGASDGLPRAT